MHLHGGSHNSICSGLDENSFHKQETLGTTLILAQTAAFPQRGRTGLVLATAMAEHWEILTLLVYMDILQREEGFLASRDVHASKWETGIQS